MKSKLSVFTLSVIIIITCQTMLYAQMINFQFSASFQYETETFSADETHFTAINNPGMIVGYYKNQNGHYTGLAYNKLTGKAVTYHHPGYNNTEFHGINDAGIIVGRAYDSPLSAIAIKGNIATNGQIQNVVETNWFSPTSPSKTVYKVNNKNIAVGGAQSQNSRYLVFEDLTNSANFGATRFATGNFPNYTYFNTFGLGINDIGYMTGFYIDGATYNPVLYDSTTNTFHALAHKNNAGAPRTYINDINNEKYVAVSYRIGNIFYGTIGRINASNQIVYDNNFPEIHPNGSAVNGINDSNSIVGTFVNDYNKTIAFYAMKDPVKFNDVEIPNNTFTVPNVSDSIGYENVVFYDYTTTDPYLGVNFNFLAALSQLPTPPFLSEINSLYDNKIYPSWKAYNLITNSFNNYILDNGDLIPRIESVMNWIANSDLDFRGACYGMSLFVLQHLKDPAVLHTRFPGKIPHVAAVNDLTYPLLLDPEFREVIAAMQLIQKDTGLLNINHRFDEIFTIYLDANSTVTPVMIEIIKTDINELARAIMHQNADSLYILDITIADFQSQTTEMHAVIPYKISRNLNFPNYTDTIYCIDPNLPDSILRIVCNHNESATAGVGFDEGGYPIYTIPLLYKNSRLKDNKIQTNKILKENHPENNENFKSQLQNFEKLYLNQICDYTIVNVNSPAEYIDKTGSGFQNSLSDIYMNFNYNSDLNPKLLHSREPMYLQSTLRGCQENKLMHQFQNGSMIYYRDDVQPNEEDIVFNKAKNIKAQNPNTADINVSMASIYSSDIAEAYVGISGFLLTQNDTVSMETINRFQVKLSNGNNQQNSYNLYVRHLAENDFFIWSHETISIDSETDHIILLQPHDEENQVIILVDNNQNGEYEDTLFGTVSSVVSLPQHETKVSIYPNPVSDHLHFNFLDIEDGYYSINIFSTEGRLVHREVSNVGSHQQTGLDIRTFDKGVYFVVIRDASNKMIYKQQLMIH